MSFLYPYMLWALFALTIPVIIHLFNFRRHKVVYFSNTATLKNIEQENAKTKRLKYVIVMIMRMLFIAGLVFAFAYPYRKEQNLKTNDVDNLIAMYIDNSMSMQSQSSEISLIEDARSSARHLVGNINPSQRFVLLTNSRELENEYPMNRDEMLMCIDGMKTEAGFLSFNELYENLQMIMRRNAFKSASLFLYSDFQDGMMNFDGIVPDSTIQIVAMPLSSDFQQNVYVDTLWLSSPIMQVGLANEVNATIVNESEKDINGLPVNLEFNGHAVAFTTVDVNAGGESTVNMQFVIDGPGFVKAKVSVNDSPIIFDDSYNFILTARPIIKVVELTDGNSLITNNTKTDGNPLEILYSEDSLYDYTAVDYKRIDQQYLDDCQLVIVNGKSLVNETMWQSVVDFARKGGSVVVFPSADDDCYTDTLNVSMLAYQHSFFDDMFVNIPDNADYPRVFKHVGQNLREFDNSLTLISLQNGDPLLLLNKVGKGNIFRFSSRLDGQWSDMADNSLFVPLLMKMAMLGGGAGKLSYVIGVDKDIVIDNHNVTSDGDVRIKDENGTFEVIPLVEHNENRTIIHVYDQLPNAGFYDVVYNGDVLSQTAWNDSRLESKMKFEDQNIIEEKLKDNGFNVLAVMKTEELYADDVMDVIVRKSMLWKSFILLSLLSLLIEILILRFWK